MALFLLQYGINDSAEILLAPVYRVRAGFGTRLDTRRPRCPVTNGCSTGRSMSLPGDNGPEAIATIRYIGKSVDSTTAVVIFPEGRLFRPGRLERATARLAVENPEHAARLASLGHVLPPRPGGVLALLDSTSAEVVVVSHSGLDQFASFTDLAKAVPLRDPIRITAWRIPVDQIPTADAERITCLDEQWLLADRWIGDQH